MFTSYRTRTRYRPTIFLKATTTTAFLLLSLLFSTPTTTADVIVLDSVGNPLVVGSYYYAVPVSPLITQKVGGGLTMFNTGSVGCPSFIVAQSSLRGPLDYGIPIKFSPNVNVENNVYTSSKVNIAFKYLSPQPLCRRLYTKVWAVSGSKNGNLVVLDGVEGSDSSLFKLEYGYHFDGSTYYYITYEDNVVLSENNENGGILLGFEKGSPLFVTFVKEEEGSRVV